MATSTERRRETQSARETHSAGAKDRFWELRAWSGMSFSGWLRVLVDHRFAVSPSRIAMVLIITLITLCNSSLWLLQALLYGRRISQARIEQAPIFVLGHWRSGTTLLHELLVCDPRHTYANTYACFGPNHFLLTSRLMFRCLRFLFPSQRPMDGVAIRWDSPQEDEWALCNMGLPSPYLKILFPNLPSRYKEYLDLRRVPAADRERWKRKFRWFLKCVTIDSDPQPPKRLVLKAPPHTCRVKTLLEMFPDALFVHIVRDPYTVFPSTVHTWKRLYKYHGAQVPRYEDIEEHVFETFNHMYEVFQQDRELIDDSRLCEVRYEDLVRDPIGQMRMLYEHLGLGEFESVLPMLRRYVSKTADYRTNRYSIPPDVRRQVTQRWHAYIERYDYGPRAASAAG